MSEKQSKVFKRLLWAYLAVTRTATATHANGTRAKNWNARVWLTVLGVSRALRARNNV